MATLQLKGFANRLHIGVMPKLPLFVDCWTPTSRPDVSDNSGLYEFNESMHALCRSRLDIMPVDIGRISEFWLDVGDGFSSAGFLLLLNDSRRIYLDVWVEQTGNDGATPPKVEIGLEELIDEQRYPAFNNFEEAPNGWRDDVGTLNEFLVSVWQSADGDEEDD